MIQFIKDLQSQKYTSLALTSIDIIFMLSFLLILLICCFLLHKAYAASLRLIKFSYLIKKSVIKEMIGFKLMVTTALI